MVGGKNIFAGRANIKSPARTNTKLMLDKYKVGAHKSVTVTGTNLISKGFASCHGVLTPPPLRVSTATEVETVNPYENGNQSEKEKSTVRMIHA